MADAYFDSAPSRWDVLEFLDQCCLVGFNKKIDSYLSCLKVIVDSESTKARHLRAISLLDSYRKVCGFGG